MTTMHRTTGATRLAMLAILFGMAGRSAAAQWSGGVGIADSLLAMGRVASAESLYYAASSARPRDAAARAALGRYLASRGALRIGAVLLEEARLFGGDTARIARSLAPIYLSLGDYRSLATLPASPLSPAEQKRVRWLVSHPSVLEFPDSAATLAYHSIVDGSGIGVLSLGIGDHRVDALIDPRASGVIVRGRAARRRDGLHTFGDDSSGVVAVVHELHIGDVTLGHVPARLIIDSAPGTPRSRQVTIIGLDVLQRLAPTFNPTTQMLTLRRSGQIAQVVSGTRTPMLLDEQGFRVLVDDHWVRAGSGATAKLLATRPWTLDAKRGAIVLQ